MKRITISDIARAAGVSRQAISQGIKRGEFGKDTARRLAEVTGIEEVVWLYGPRERIREAIKKYVRSRGTLNRGTKKPKPG